MLHKDTDLLQEAYLSVLKKSTVVPSDREKISTNASSSVSTSPIKELAPKQDTESAYSEEDDFEEDDFEEDDFEEEHDTTGIPVSMEVHGGHESSMHGDKRFSVNDEDEEDDMTIDNLHSIKDSLMKIAMAVSAGVHMEPWQQFKIAIVMDNLASIARSLPRQQTQHSSCGY